MKPKSPSNAEKRVRIAEKCGWKVELVNKDSNYWATIVKLTNPAGEVVYTKADWSDDRRKSDATKWQAVYEGITEIPDYFNDLDAMHLAEECLTEEQLHQMNEILYENPQVSRVWRASAFHRAEALYQCISPANQQT